MSSHVKFASALALLLAVLPFGIAWADENDVDDDLVLEIVDDPDAGEEDYVEEIRLPEQAADQARESAASGLETANEARERGRDFGQERAEQARELGRDAREERGEQRRGRPEGVGTERDDASDIRSTGRDRGEENRGNRGRSE